MSRGFRWAAMLAPCVMLFLAGCPQGDGAGPAIGGTRTGARPGGERIVVWADPLLKGALDAIVKEHGEALRAELAVEYRESAQLQAISDAAAPDVVLGTEPVVKQLLRHALIDESTARTFAGDLMVVATPKVKPVIVTKIGDLVMVQFAAFGLGSAGTSVGFYGEQALISDGVLDRLKDTIRRFDSTEALLAALRDGSVPLGILFGSTVAQQQDLRISMTVPEDLYQDIRYMAVGTKAAAARPAVIELLKLLAENGEVQQTLGAYGYLDRATALEDTR